MNVFRSWIKKLCLESNNAWHSSASHSPSAIKHQSTLHVSTAAVCTLAAFATGDLLHQAIAQPAAASTIDQTALMKERREPMQHPSSKKLPRQPLPHRIWQISGSDRFILTLVGSAIMLVLAANAAAAQSI